MTNTTPRYTVRVCRSQAEALGIRNDLRNLGIEAESSGRVVKYRQAIELEIPTSDEQTA